MYASYLNLHERLPRHIVLIAHVCTCLVAEIPWICPYGSEEGDAAEVFCCNKPEMRAPATYPPHFVALQPAHG